MPNITSTKMSVEETIDKDKIKICIPGMRLSPSNKDFVPGLGTYEVNGYIYSALAGLYRTVVDDDTKVTQIVVESLKSPSILPKEGDIVTAKVTVVTPRFVQCSILSVGLKVFTRNYRGVIKKEEIRSTDRDRVDPYKCYRSGDIILAKVLPMTEVHWYHLTTAENELGVAIAKAEKSPQGVNMVPISWNEMQCPQTLVKEPRKVAKVLPDNIHHPTTELSDFYKNGLGIKTKADRDREIE